MERGERDLNGLGAFGGAEACKVSDFLKRTRMMGSRIATVFSIRCSVGTEQSDK
jgi:hypothetical protein